MLALPQVFAAILDLLPEPPGSRSLGPVDPRLDPEALATFALAELAHPELPRRYSFERAQDARDQLAGRLDRSPAVRVVERRQRDDVPPIAAVELPAITELPAGWARDQPAEDALQPAPLGTRVIRSGSALRPDRPRGRWR